MYEKLSPRQQKELAEAILSVYPTQGALKSTVYFGLDEDLDGIVKPGGSLRETVQDLLAWASATGKMDDLVEGILQANPGNPKLYQVAKKLQKQRSISTASTDEKTPIVSPQLRRSLIEALMLLPLSEDHAGRTGLLIGIPYSESMPRSKSAREDLKMIVNNLADLPRFKSGTWPLMLLVDNAVAYAGESGVEKRLRDIRKKLSTLYGEEVTHWKY